ncbi:MAG: PASTA domain-containing protein [bacterium]|nr:PASTA domain-containing protein [bacterium]
MKYVAGAAGRGALFPGAETEVEGERVTRLQLNLGAGKVPEPAAAVPAPVPAVVGLTELMARSNLNAAGFLAEVHGQVVTADDQVGKVVSQLPAALTEAEPNSAVRVFLGKAG